MEIQGKQMPSLKMVYEKPFVTYKMLAIVTIL